MFIFYHTYCFNIYIYILKVILVLNKHLLNHYNQHVFVFLTTNTPLLTRTKHEEAKSQKYSSESANKVI